MTHRRLWDWLSNVANEGRYGVTWIDSERSVVLIPWPRRLDSSGENVFTVKYIANDLKHFKTSASE